MTAVISRLERWQKLLLTLSSFVSAAAIALGAVSLKIYWALFDVDILIQLTAADILKHIAVWLAFAVCCAFAGTVIGSTLSTLLDDRKGWLGQPIVNLGLRTLIILPVGLFFFYLWDVPSIQFYAWALVPIALLTLWFHRVIKRLAYAMFKNEGQIFNAALIAAVVLVGVPIRALAQAVDVIDGRIFEAVTMLPLRLEDRMTVGVDPHQQLRLIGHIGEYVYLYRPETKSTLVVRLQNGDRYELKRVRK